jgi:hypothetical protein
MKYFIQLSSLLAAVAVVIAVAVASGGSSSDRRLIAEKWAILEPSLEFHGGDSTIRLKYNRAGDVQDNNQLDIVSSSVSLWSKECQSGGGTEFELKDDSAVAVENAVVGIALDRLWNNFIEHETDYPGAVFDKTASATTATTRPTIGFCVRYALSERTIIASENENENNEINFVESVVTATIVTKKKELREEDKGDDDASFEVIAATVAPVSQREDPLSSLRQHEQTFYHGYNHTIEAFLCPNGGNDNTPIIATVSQGSVVTLCVQTSARDGSIRVASIEEFTWTKRKAAKPAAVMVTKNYNINNTDDSPQTVTLEKRQRSVISDRSDSGSGSGSGSGNNNNNDDSIIVSQQAIRNGAAADMFTSHNGCRDEKPSFCSVSTLLMSEFYSNAWGSVSGTGTLTLAFGTKGEKEKRKFSYDP